jgi:hypothetical protein
MALPKLFIAVTWAENPDSLVTPISLPTKANKSNDEAAPTIAPGTFEVMRVPAPFVIVEASKR